MIPPAIVMLSTAAVIGCYVSTLVFHEMINQVTEKRKKERKETDRKIHKWKES